MGLMNLSMNNYNQHYFLFNIKDEVGVQIIGDLEDQRESLIRSRDKVHHLHFTKNGCLSESNHMVEMRQSKICNLFYKVV